MLVITEKKLLKYALYCNAIYIFLLFLFRPNEINIEKIIISSFLAVSVIGVLVCCLRNTYQLKKLTITDRRLFFLLMFWGIIVVVRSFSLSVQDWLTNFGNVYMALAWFTPILLVLGIKIENWKTVFQALFFMFNLMFLSLLMLPFYLDNGKLKTEWTWLLRPVNFVILFGVNRFKITKRIIVYFAFSIYILIGVLTEQRLEFIYIVLLIVIIFLDKIYQVKIKRKFLKLTFFSTLLITTLVFTFGYENLTKIATNYIDYQDTRVFLYEELLEELQGYEKIVGRGSLGTYYSDFFERTTRYYYLKGDTAWKGDEPERITIEVGYLQMILKGGFLMFILMFYIMIRSSYLGIFKSNNRLVKRLGIYIFIISSLSLISFRPAFTPTFILLWMAIGTVLNKRNREMSDEEVNSLIKFN